VQQALDPLFLRYWLFFYVGSALVSVLLPVNVGLLLDDPIWLSPFYDGSLYLFSLATVGGGAGSYLYQGSRVGLGPEHMHPPAIWHWQVLSAGSVLGLLTLIVYTIKLIGSLGDRPLRPGVEPLLPVVLALAAVLYGLSCEMKRQAIA
jgi:hypothetical protein